MEKKELKLKHFGLFAKGWYNKNGNEKNPQNIWTNVMKVLTGDDYQPETKNDVIGILTSNIMRLVRCRLMRGRNAAQR